MREKLIEILRGAINTHTEKKEQWILGGKVGEEPMLFGSFADHLIANGVTVQRWIPVTDRLPEKDGKYLVAIKYGNGYVGSIRKFRREVPCWWAGAGPRWERRTAGVRFWMPLPEPPKEE